MKRKSITFFLILCLVAVGVLIWQNHIGYTIDGELSNTELKPLEGVTFTIIADKKDGFLQIENNSDHYIVIEFSRKPIQIEIQKEDGWHRLRANNIVQAEPCAIPEGATYSLDFDWKNFVNGPLKPGNYRAVLYFGDGVVDLYNAYSVAADFSVN